MVLAYFECIVHLERPIHGASDYIFYNLYPIVVYGLCICMARRCYTVIVVASHVHDVGNRFRTPVR